MRQKPEFEAARDAIIILMALSLIMTSGVKVIELRLTRWRPEKVKTF